MPPRVVTADLEAIVGHPVLAVVAMPYRDGPSVPAPLSNGRYLDVLVMLPAGVASADNATGRVYEHPPRAVGRLRQDDADGGGHLHEIWGHPRRAAPLTQEEADQGPRTATLTVDLGARINARVDGARGVSRGDGRVVAEVLLQATAPNASNPGQGIYDALEDHPEALRGVIEGGGQARREQSTDEPPTWGRARAQAVAEALSTPRG